MFLENAHSLAMIKHSMDVIRAAVHHVNPAQIRGIAFDQPLFALAKQIQWSFASTHGEDHFVLMLGGLHIEMTAYKALGKWMDDSGWTEVLYTAGVATQGVANSFLTASHLTRTRRAHQVMAASLHLLQQKAYQEYVSTASDGQVREPAVATLPISPWSAKRRAEGRSCQVSQGCCYLRDWTTNSRCNHTGWSSYRPDAATRNGTYL